MGKKTKPISDCYVFLLSKAYQKGHQLVAKHFERLGLTNIQYLVLEALWHEEGLTAMEIGKRLSIDKATLSGVLDRMAEAGWVIKTRDDRDKRMVRLSPSLKANEMREELVGERQAANEELLAPFSIEERVLLRRLLLDLI